MPGHRADELLHKHGLLALFYPNRRYMMEAIKTDKLTKKYKNLTAVDSLDLLVEQESCSLCWVSTAQEKLPRSRCFPA